MGHLQHGALLLGIRALSLQRQPPTSMTWVESHLERRKEQQHWTQDDWGIHKADGLAGTHEGSSQSEGLQIFHCNAELVYAPLTPSGTWQWREGTWLHHGSFQKRVHSFHLHQYKKMRDMYRIYANEPSRWTRYCLSLMATLTRTKSQTPRQKSRRTKHLFDCHPT